MLAYTNINAVAGWSLVAAGMAAGMALTPVFLRDSLAGGYASFRRRFLRLGHIACVVLGVLNILAGVGQAASNVPLIVGSVGMSAGCWIAAAWERFKFVLPAFAALLLWGSAREILRALSGGSP